MPRRYSPQSPKAKPSKQISKPSQQLGPRYYVSQHLGEADVAAGSGFDLGSRFHHGI
jgi:hypothetical protein